ncbi:hypothetical protein [Aeoliella sp.]|uniref:hypothetical protein n=1 Tax=Aeoliella sp. TaxID=2795800 RepID=UPI003CCBAF21
MLPNAGARLRRALLPLLWVTAGAVVAGEPPAVQFDLPKLLVAHQVVEAAQPSTARLVEVTFPVSARVLKGSAAGVDEITIEIDGARSGLVVHDFAPQTTLGSEHAGDIQVTTTQEKSKTFDATLGGQSPIPIGEVVAQVTPSISGGMKDRTAETKTTSRLPPKRPVVVSGTINDSHGAFFQLRPSSQTTLEGQHTMSVVFRVPDDWTAGQLEVRCWARGERQILWFDQPQVWGSTRRTVAVELAAPVLLETQPPTIAAKRHVVAKQPTSETGDAWVPVKE